MGNNVIPAFWSAVAMGGYLDGDHAEGDGLTKFQSIFPADTGSEDISSCLAGPGVDTGTGMSLVNDPVDGDYLNAYLSGNISHSYRDWTSSCFGRRASTGLTFEFFTRSVDVDPNPVGSQGVMGIDLANMDPIVLSVGGYSGGQNVYGLTAGAWLSWAGTQDVFSLGAYTHFAFVWDATVAGDLSIYVGGTRVTVVAGTGDKVYAALVGNFKPGGLGAAFSASNHRYSGIRLRHAQMYTGASFAPPPSPLYWGPP